MTLRKFIAGSTFIGLFSSNFFFKVGSVHLLYFYLLMALNLILIFQAGYSWFPSGLSICLSFLLLTGMVGYLQGTDSIALFFKSYVGIVLAGTYFCAFLRYMRFDVEYCFAIYARIAFYAAVFGIAFLPVQIALTGLPRLASIMSEPAAFALVICPALYYYADQWQRLGKRKWRFIVLLISILLSGSSSGFIGVLLGIYLFGRRYRFGNYIMPIVVLLSGFLLYSTFSDFRLRYNDTIKGLSTSEITNLNASSFALVSNAYVTTQVLSEHPVLGNGLGSHPISHEQYVGNLDGIADFILADIGDLNAIDAGALSLRILSEMGFFGLALALLFIVWFYPRTATPSQRAIADSILTYFLMKLLRSGIYFDPEVFFFFVVYAVNGLHKLRKASISLPSHGLDSLILMPHIDSLISGEPGLC